MKIIKSKCCANCKFCHKGFNYNVCDVFNKEVGEWNLCGLFQFIKEQSKKNQLT